MLRLVGAESYFVLKYTLLEAGSIYEDIVVKYTLLEAGSIYEDVVVKF